MKGLLFGLIFIFSGCLLFPEENSSLGPQEPIEPVFEELKLPQITNEVPAGETNLLFLMKGSAVLSDGHSFDGTVFLTSNIIFQITNITGQSMAIRSISLYDITRIAVTVWKPERKENDVYLFTPVEYQFYTNDLDTNFIVYKGNIGVFDNFILSGENGRRRYFTIFYDRWIQGKKEGFRWENSRASVFTYEFSHPIAGVVTNIRFSKNY